MKDFFVTDIFFTKIHILLDNAPEACFILNPRRHSFDEKIQILMRKTNFFLMAQKTSYTTGFRNISNGAKADHLKLFDL